MIIIIVINFSLVVLFFGFDVPPLHHRDGVIGHLQIYIQKERRASRNSSRRSCCSYSSVLVVIMIFILLVCPLKSIHKYTIERAAAAASGANDELAGSWSLRPIFSYTILYAYAGQHSSDSVYINPNIIHSRRCRRCAHSLRIINGTHRHRRAKSLNRRASIYVSKKEENNAGSAEIGKR